MPWVPDKKPTTGFDPEGSGYDSAAADPLIKKYPLTIPKPDKYQGDYVTQDNAFEAWAWHPELNDYLKHQGSRNPETGQILKGKKHPTFNLTIQGEESSGYEIYKNSDGLYYSRPKTEMNNQQVDDILLQLQKPKDTPDVSGLVFRNTPEVVPQIAAEPGQRPDLQAPVIPDSRVATGEKPFIDIIKHGVSGAAKNLTLGALGLEKMAVDVGQGLFNLSQQVPGAYQIGGIKTPDAATTEAEAVFKPIQEAVDTHIASERQRMDAYNNAHPEEATGIVPTGETEWQQFKSTMGQMILKPEAGLQYSVENLPLLISGMAGGFAGFVAPLLGQSYYRERVENGTPATQAIPQAILESTINAGIEKWSLGMKFGVMERAKIAHPVLSRIVGAPWRVAKSYARGAGEEYTQQINQNAWSQILSAKPSEGLFTGVGSQAAIGGVVESAHTAGFEVAGTVMGEGKQPTLTQMTTEEQMQTVETIRQNLKDSTPDTEHENIDVALNEVRDQIQEGVYQQVQPEIKAESQPQAEAIRVDAVAEGMNDEQALQVAAQEIAKQQEPDVVIPAQLEEQLQQPEPGTPLEFIDPVETVVPPVAPAPVQSTPAEGKAKEPWQMTKGELAAERNSVPYASSDEVQAKIDEQEDILSKSGVPDKEIDANPDVQELYRQRDVIDNKELHDAFDGLTKQIKDAVPDVDAGEILKRIFYLSPGDLSSVYMAAQHTQKAVADVEKAGKALISYLTFDYGTKHNLDMEGVLNPGRSGWTPKQISDFKKTVGDKARRIYDAVSGYFKGDRNAVQNQETAQLLPDVNVVEGSKDVEVARQETSPAESGVGVSEGGQEVNVFSKAVTPKQMDFIVNQTTTEGPTIPPTIVIHGQEEPSRPQMHGTPQNMNKPKVTVPIYKALKQKYRAQTTGAVAGWKQGWRDRSVLAQSQIAKGKTKITETVNKWRAQLQEWKMQLASRQREVQAVKDAIVGAAKLIPSNKRSPLLTMLKTIRTNVRDGTNYRTLMLAMKYIRDTVDTTYRNEMVANIKDGEYRIEPVEGKRWIAKIANAPLRYRDLYHAITDSLQITGRPRRETGKILQELQNQLGIAAQTGLQTLAPKQLILKAAKVSIKDLSLQEIEDIHDTLREIAKQGALEQQLTIGRKKQSVEQTAEKVVSTIRNTRKTVDRGDPGRRPEGFKEKVIEPIKQKLAGYAMNHTRLMRLFRWLDGQERGVLTTQVWEPVSNSINDFMDAISEKPVKMGMFLNSIKLDHRSLYKRRDFGGLRLSPSEAVEIYLASHDTAKLRHLLGGNTINKQSIDVKGVVRIIQNMTPQERAFGDWLLKEYKSYWPLIARVYEILNDEHLSHITGYSRILTDRKSSDFADDFKQELEERRWLLERLPDQSFLHQREGGVRQPLILDAVNNYLHNIGSFERYIHMAIPASNARKILGNEDVKNAINSATKQKGVEYINKWLTDSVTNTTAIDHSPLAPFFTMTRRNGAAAIMTLNFVAAMKSGVSVFTSMGHSPIGMMYILRAMAMPNWFGSYKFAHEKSSILRHRFMEAEFREIHDENDLYLKLSGKKSWRERAAFMSVGFDQFAVTATWKGIYDYEMSKHGNEETAIREADRWVVSTHSATRIVDLPGYWRGTALEKMFTLFQNETNQMYNIIKYDVNAERKAGNIGMSQALWRTAWATFIPLALLSMISRGFTPSKEDLAKDVVSNFAQMYFFFGNIISAAITGYGDETVPMHFAKTSARTLLDTYKGIIETDAEKQQKYFTSAGTKAVETAAFLTGTPFIQPMRTFEGIKGMSQGEEDLRTLIWRKNMITNEPKATKGNLKTTPLKSKSLKSGLKAKPLKAG
jgi:hypothetical protein